MKGSETWTYKALNLSLGFEWQKVAKIFFVENFCPALDLRPAKTTGPIDLCIGSFRRARKNETFSLECQPCCYKLNGSKMRRNKVMFLKQWIYSLWGGSPCLKFGKRPFWKYTSDWCGCEFAWKVMSLTVSGVKMKWIGQGSLTLRHLKDRGVCEMEISAFLDV